ncbi:MAG: dockerin type I domain-containing protein [Planctomycetota bacterium]
MKRLTMATSILFALISNSGEGLASDSPLNLGPEELVRADGMDITVPGYSVPSFEDWNGDNLKDLIIGEGEGFGDAKVRVYINIGTESDPQFSDYFYAQSNGTDLTCPASGCMGCFPRPLYWDADARKDLLIGQADGTVKIFFNTGIIEEPTFDGGRNVQVDSPAANLAVVGRATPAFLDWNNDRKTDLVVGALDGRIHIYLNCGCGGAVPPSFNTSTTAGIFVLEDGMDLVVPSKRSSPQILDLDGDGKKDILTGNTDGQLLFYRNVGTDAEPVFSGYSPMTSDGVPIDLPGSPRSRPFVCYWTGDGYPDVLIGAGDGKIHLYRGIPTPGDLDTDGDVDFTDFAVFAACWHYSGDEKCSFADLTGDGKVDIDDLYVLAANWPAGDK